MAIVRDDEEEGMIECTDAYTCFISLLARLLLLFVPSC